MSGDDLWFIDKNKMDCSKCGGIKTTRIEYYHAFRTPIETNNEFILNNLVKKKTLKICESCNFKDESWEEWKEVRYPKGYESDFLKRRALYFKANVPFMAEEGFRDYFKIKPSDLEMHFEFGEFLVQKEEYAEAYSELKKVLERKKDHIPALESMNELLFTLFISQNEFWYEKRLHFGIFTRIFSRFQDLKKELNHNLRTLLDYYKNDSEKMEKYYLQAGYLMEDLRNFPLAMDYFGYVLQASSNLIVKSESCIRMAIIYSNLQDYEKAYEYLNKSNQFVPNVLIHLYRTKILYKQGENEKAEQELAIYKKEIDRIITKNPQNAQLYYFKGLGLEFSESNKTLIEFYEWITSNLTIDIKYRKIFYAKVQNLRDIPEEILVEGEGHFCPICQSRKMKIIQYRDQIIGLNNWADGINSTVYYMRRVKKICMNCRYDWWEYFNWDERESEYPG